MIALGSEAALMLRSIGIDLPIYPVKGYSFTAELAAPVVGGPFPGVFIRAPRLSRIGAGVEVVATLARTPDATPEPAGVRAGRTVGLCFHPELTSDLRFHRWFLAEVAGLRLPSLAGVGSSGSAHERPAR